ncbi:MULTISPECIES: hypothetical protein [unclassified Micromonospora]|uniref:TolB family protein n=1 Tax=unclassified Micromonospora TaxID=2617518 RepID=UPI0013D30285|nr:MULTISPECIES: hypothetical protein [unclassified Micromonospora]NES15939.1 hypothetical protein [Micromonospora sp. PPF5-17B]NES58856.1 hypothetical protein [Micromonospora sp. PPF5-6]
MNEDRLRFDLAELADEVTPVDLRDRALRTSRRIGIQRAVTTSVAALVMVAAATGTALAIRPNGQANLPAPATTVTTTAPPVEVTPTPDPSASEEAPATSSASAEPTATIGRLYYGPKPGSTTAGTAHLWWFEPDGSRVQLPAIETTALELNAVVSPDGERVAWVDSSSQLWVANVDGSKKRMLKPGGRPLVEPDCFTPAWSRDSRKLLVSRVLSAEPSLVMEQGVVDVTSGRYEAIRKIKGCHPLWSADGRTLAYADGEGRIAVSRADGSGQRFIPGLGGRARYASFDLTSLSPDGSRIALLRRGSNEDAGDVARELDVNAVLDTRTGKEIDLPLGGRTLRQAYFQADGTLVLRLDAGDHNVLVLVGADGAKLSETEEPAALKDMQILQIAG